MHLAKIDDMELVKYLEEQINIDTSFKGSYIWCVGKGSKKVKKVIGFLHGRSTTEFTLAAHEKNRIYLESPNCGVIILDDFEFEGSDPAEMAKIKQVLKYPLNMSLISGWYGKTPNLYHKDRERFAKFLLANSKRLGASWQNSKVESRPLYVMGFPISFLSLRSLTGKSNVAGFCEEIILSDTIGQDHRPLRKIYTECPSHDTILSCILPIMSETLPGVNKVGYVVINQDGEPKLSPVMEIHSNPFDETSHYLFYYDLKDYDGNAKCMHNLFHEDFGMFYRYFSGLVTKDLSHPYVNQGSLSSKDIKKIVLPKTLLKIEETKDNLLSYLEEVV